MFIYHSSTHFEQSKTFLSLSPSLTVEWDFDLSRIMMILWIITTMTMLPLFDTSLLHNFAQQLWQFISAHPIATFFAILLTFLLYKIVNFREIVVDYPNDVPKSVRMVADQKLSPSFPNGWIPVLESRAIRVNEVKSVLCFGVELAVIRGAKGQVYVIDAFCPHLGANLAAGGTVNRNECNDDCIRCPFHGWSFRMTDGHCSNIPYESSPANAKVKLWRSIELNNAIFVWHHADDVDPVWHPQAVNEIADGEWVYQGRTEHFVNCHVQEIPENGADVAHLGEIHVGSFWFGSDLNWINKIKKYLYPILEHEWSAQWNPCEPPNEHMSSIVMVNVNKLFGFTLFTVQLSVSQVGPVYVELRFKANFLGGVKGILLQFVKPIGPMRNSIIHQIYTDNTLAGYIFGKFLIIAEAKMLERDIQIWNRKAFLKKPFISKSERSLVKYRRWFSQFYSENSKCMIDW